MCVVMMCVQGEGVVCPVDASGRFTEDVTDFKGQYVKVRTHTHTQREVSISLYTQEAVYTQCSLLGC